MMTWFKRAALACAFLCAILNGPGAIAQQQEPGSQISQKEQIANERKAAAEAADKAAKRGPATLPLGEQGTIVVPEKYMFIPQPEAGRFLRAMGNTPSPMLTGMLLPEDDGNWLATIQFNKSGYVRDEEAKNWNTMELLQGLKDGVEEGNSERIARGFPPFEVIGWVERPDYDAANHRLVWSVNARDKGVPASGDDTVNYNTYVLGREGYFSLNFVTDVQSIAAQKPIARQLLSALSFMPGKTYADYNSVTDHAAEFGIGALIAGGAAKKLGLFAVFGAFFLKAGKLLIIPVIAGLALLRKLFSRDKGSV